MIDPLLFAVVTTFRYRRLWSRHGHTFVAATPHEGRAVVAVGSSASDALATLLAKQRAQGGGVDA